MLTTALRDSLGGNCRTVMVANVAATSDQAEETISTCRFAQRVAMISNTVGNPPGRLRHGALFGVCENVRGFRTADSAFSRELCDRPEACHWHQVKSWFGISARVGMQVTANEEVDPAVLIRLLKQETADLREELRSISLMILRCCALL